MEPATLKNTLEKMVKTLKNITFNTSKGNKIKMLLFGLTLQDLVWSSSVARCWAGTSDTNQITCRFGPRAETASPHGWMTLEKMSSLLLNIRLHNFH